jgi:hypothetical protein
VLVDPSVTFPAAGVEIYYMFVLIMKVVVEDFGRMYGGFGRAFMDLFLDRVEIAGM